MRKLAISLATLVALGGILPSAATATAASTGEGTAAAAPGPPAPFDLQRCRLQVSLDPESHHLAATAELTVVATSPDAGALRLELHPDLAIEEVRRDGEAVAVVRVEAEAPDAGAGEGGEGAEAGEAGDEEGAAEEGSAGEKAGDLEEEGETEEPAAVYELAWEPGTAGGTVTVRYGGALIEDVMAGEKPGQIHNFEVDAHIGPEGVFLSEGVPWYPRPAPPAGEDDGDREPDLAFFEVTARAVPGMLLVAGGDRQGAALDRPRGEATTWESPFPLPGLTLVGGPHEAHQRQVGPVLVSLHLLPGSAPFAPGLLDAVEHYLELYVPLLGPYPYRELTVVENFFSSGFAMPGFTVLASPVIQMGERGLRPGYVDHELLHNWWGNSVFTSYRGGNWAEGLTSYTTNYMRRVLEGKPEEARAYRRDTTHSLSRLTPEQDKPLGSFGEEDGAGRLIGYQKGAMVFVQLAQRLGEETVWRALARFYRDNKGKVAGWGEIQAAFEAEAGRPLGAFFDFWVHRGGLPEITLGEVVYDPGTARLDLNLRRSGGDGLPLEVPLRVLGDDAQVERTVTLDGEVVTASVELPFAPRRVVLDPDYRVLRKLPADLLMPTLSGVRRGKRFTIVRAEGDLAGYEAALPALTARFEEEGEGAVREVAAGDFGTSDAAEGHTLLLGRAAATEAGRALLAPGPLRIEDGAFRVGDESFAEADQAVLCCLRNQADPGGVICAYYANGEAALERASLLSFYGGNSLIVFDAGRPALRRDFDQTESVEVVTAAP